MRIFEFENDYLDWVVAEDRRDAIRYYAKRIASLSQREVEQTWCITEVPERRWGTMKIGEETFADVMKAITEPKIILTTNE